MQAELTLEMDMTMASRTAARVGSSDWLGSVVSSSEMVRVIVTQCGRELRRVMKVMDELRRHDMRHALVGCGTNDDAGAYVEIADVYFILPNAFRTLDL